MTSATTSCPQCGAAFPAGYAAPLCPACLLKLGFESRDPSAGPATSPYQPRFLVPTPEELAPRFPQLEILERIGAGGMGVVYRARQKELDRIVALKILRPDFGPEANFAERFQREARAMARLSHPHIVTVHDFGRIDDVFYFVMEYIDGVNLRQLEKAGQLAPAQALALVPQVCEALQYAHEQGVVHRDIKPENILITRDGRVKIADFGLAKLAGHAEQAHLTGTWQVMGTPHYMAPEQVERPTEVDHRADIYSLGVVFYEMLTGELPLGRFPLPSSKCSSISDWTTWSCGRWRSRPNGGISMRPTCRRMWNRFSRRQRRGLRQRSRSPRIATRANRKSCGNGCWRICRSPPTG